MLDKNTFDNGSYFVIARFAEQVVESFPLAIQLQVYYRFLIPMLNNC